MTETPNKIEFNETNSLPVRCPTCDKGGRPQNLAVFIHLQTGNACAICQSCDAMLMALPLAREAILWAVNTKLATIEPSRILKPKFGPAN